MRKPVYYVEIRFGEVLRGRLRRNDKSITALCDRFDLSETELSLFFNGEVPMGTYFTFHQLDRYFETSKGYFQSVYNTCAEQILKELGDDQSLVPKLLCTPIPKGQMLVPIDLVESIVKSNSLHLNYSKDALQLSKLLRRNKP